MWFWQSLNKKSVVIMHMCPGKTKLTEQKTIRWCLLWLDWTRLDDVYFDSDEISWGRLRPIEWEKMHLLTHIYSQCGAYMIELAWCLLWPLFFYSISWMFTLTSLFSQLAWCFLWLFFFTQLAGCLLRFWWDSPVAGHHQARSHHW